MRRSTIVFILLFAVAMGVYYYIKNRPNNTVNTTPTPEIQTPTTYLFTTSDGQPTDIRIESKAGAVVEVARNSDKTWALVQPNAASADQGSVEAAVSQLTSMLITDKLSADVKPADVGMDSPEYKLSVKFDSGVERNVDIGVSTPTDSGYYVQSNGEIVIVSKASVDALTSMLTNPPYAETPTPSPVPPTATNTSLPSSIPEPGTATPTATTQP